MESIEKNSLVPKDDHDCCAAAVATAGMSGVGSGAMSETDQAKMNALADELEEVVVQLEAKCSEVDEWKANFESLQVNASYITTSGDRAQRTSTHFQPFLTPPLPPMSTFQPH